MPESSDACNRGQTQTHHAHTDTHLCKLNLLLTSLTQISHILCDFLYTYSAAHAQKDARAHGTDKCVASRQNGAAGWTAPLSVTKTAPLLIVPFPSRGHGMRWDVLFCCGGAGGSPNRPSVERKPKPGLLYYLTRPNQQTRSEGFGSGKRKHHTAAKKQRSGSCVSDVYSFAYM